MKKGKRLQFIAMAVGVLMFLFAIACSAVDEGKPLPQSPLLNAQIIKAPDTGTVLGQLGIRDGKPDFVPDKGCGCSGAIVQPKTITTAGASDLQINKVTFAKQTDPQPIYIVHFHLNKDGTITIDGIEKQE